MAIGAMDLYQVQEYLAEGGMGAIYRGKKIGPSGDTREVVLKQLLPEFTQQAEFIDLFVREAKLSASLNHPNIIRTTDLVTAGDDYFIVMEYLYGADLRTLLRRAKHRGMRLIPGAVFAIIREVLAALAYAHAARDARGRPIGLIHRDVTPSNILVSALGEVKLTDFGIAKAASHNSGLFYRVKGKIGYMSPEQARSKPMDHRSDLFSVGVCLHEALTGERLFVSSGLTTSASEMFAEPLPRVSRKVTGIAPEIDGLLARALSIDPNARFQNATEFAAAIDLAVARHGLQMSTSALSEHLRVVCGPAASWRDEVDQEPVVQPGTTVLGPDDDDEFNDELDDDREPLSVVSHEVVLTPRSRRRQADSIPNLGRLQHLQFTSFLELAGSDSAGAKPLVDLDNLGHSFDDERSMISESLASVIDSIETPATPPPVVVAPASRGSGVVVAPLSAATAVPAESPADAVAVEPKRGSRFRVVLGLVLLLVIGVAVALVIGMTGPSVPVSTTPSTNMPPPTTP